MIIVGNEHAGLEYGLRLVDLLKQKGHEVEHIFESDKMIGYPAIAEVVADKVVNHENRLGILICGTGIGMCMAAGKVPGVRVALCTNTYMGRMAKQHNNANILAFGSRVIGFENMVDVIDTFLQTQYEGERHDARLEALMMLDKKYRKSLQ